MTDTTKNGILFSDLQVRSIQIPNRIVMSPMTRSRSIDGIPGEDVAKYYRRRAEGGTGLIVTEGVALNHLSSVDHPRVPHMYGEEALAGWKHVVDEVHTAGSKIVPQLWHVGPLWGAMAGGVAEPMRPSGRWGTPGLTSYRSDLVETMRHPTRPMTENDIDDVIDAYRTAARNAADVGFDGIALHGGHGYLLDSFMWSDTNHRTDRWGGAPRERAEFPAAVVRAIREEIGDELPIIYRFSQHKQQDFNARIAETPDDLAELLGPLVDAGVDVLDASSRRFHLPAFEGSELSLAGWAKHLTGSLTMAVGSFGMGPTLRETLSRGANEMVDNRKELMERLGKEFDLIAIGRLHLAEPRIAEILRSGGMLPLFDRAEHVERYV